MQREQQLRFAIVGPGRVGRALGLALMARGMVPVGVWGRATPAASTGAIAPATEPISPRLAALAAELQAPARTSPSLELGDTDWLFLTVPDRELATVAAAFDQSGLVREDTVWIHTAGAYGVEVLPAGRPRLALHPAASITGDPAELTGLTWAVETAEAAEPAEATKPAEATGPVEAAQIRTPEETGRAGAAAARILGLLNGKMVSVPGKHRAFYHAATAVAANLSAAVWLMAEDMLETIGFDPGAAHQTVMRLAQSSLANVERAGAAGVTGPVRRGDAETVQRHLQALAAFGESASDRAVHADDEPSYLEIYRQLSLLLAGGLAKQQILTPESMLRWKRLLLTEGPD